MGSNGLEGWKRIATLRDLRERFPKSTTEWRFNCIRNRLTIEEAYQSHMEVLEKQVDRANRKARPWTA